MSLISDTSSLFAQPPSLRPQHKDEWSILFKSRSAGCKEWHPFWDCLDKRGKSQVRTCLSVSNEHVHSHREQGSFLLSNIVFVRQPITLNCCAPVPNKSSVNQLLGEMWDICCNVISKINHHLCHLGSVVRRRQKQTRPCFTVREVMQFCFALQRLRKTCTA